MDQQADEHENRPARRSGDAVWTEAREAVAKRNEQARKGGKARRAAYERERQEARRATERRQMAELLGKQRRP